jgi:hypothetical protein
MNPQSHSPVVSSSTLVTYKTPSIYQLATDLTVSINGYPVDVIQHSVPSRVHPDDVPVGFSIISPADAPFIIANRYVHFSTSGGVRIQITKNQGTIGTYSIYPHAANIQGSQSKSQLSFTLQTPQYLIVQIDNLTKLLILADPLEKDPPILGQPGVTNAQSLNLNSTDNTFMLQATIDQISLSGGGTLYFPDGVYPTGTLNLKSNVGIYLTGGAVLLGSKQLTSYPVVNYSPTPAPSASPTTTVITLLQSLGQSNVSVSGRGTIDANSDAITTSTPIKMSVLRVAGGNNIQIQGVLERAASYWTNIIGNSNNVVLDQLKVVEYELQYENDGVDICNSSNVTVSNGFVLSGDDAYSTKSYNTGNAFIDYPGGSQVAMDVSNVLFTNNVIFSNQMAYKVGVSGNKPQSHITFQNSNVVQARSLGINFNYGTSTVNNIIFQNINVDKTSSAYNNSGNQANIQINITQDKGSVSDIQFLNLNFLNFGASNSVIFGCNSVTCTGINGLVNNVTLENITINATHITSLAQGKFSTNGYASGIVIK